MLLNVPFNELKMLISSDSFQPICYEARHDKEIKALIEAFHPKIFDTYEAQLKEWIKITHPGKPLTDSELQDLLLVETNGNDIQLLGNWMYYPWSNRLVHLLEEKAFIEVRTNRNRNKITLEEQQILSTKTIGIIGLSVGQSVAVTMATERICGRLKLADFDTLDMSNLNRIRSSIHNIGLKKTIIAAREIAEMDPYLQVDLCNEGITEDNIDSFISGTNKLDLLVEVCDSLPIKILSRIKARANKVPVIMDTNDRGMIDVERFDLEPQRPLFHGLVDETALNDYARLSRQEVLEMLMKLISFENASPRLKSSMNEIGKTIATWPQLASSVVVGGGATCDTARRLLLGESIPSGRFYVDLEALI